LYLFMVAAVPRVRSGGFFCPQLLMFGGWINFPAPLPRAGRVVPRLLAAFCPACWPLAALLAGRFLKGVFLQYNFCPFTDQKIIDEMHVF
jgi:hypothetical protein